MKPLSIILFLNFLWNCSSSSNDRAVDLEDIEAIQKKDSLEMSQYMPQNNRLTAKELLEVSECTHLNCVQRFMVEHDRDFIHAKKGEFASKNRFQPENTDKIIPYSTLYLDTNPLNHWRLAHTLHDKDLGNQLYQEFLELGFTFVDSVNIISGIQGKQALFTADNYPEKELFITATYQPWYKKGLYNNEITWPCFVFEVYSTEP